MTGIHPGREHVGGSGRSRRSLPLGTFLAVGVSIVVYFGVAVVFAGIDAGSVLASDYGAMRGISIAPWLIDAGSDRGDPLLGAGVFPRRPAHPPVAGAGPGLSLAAALRRRAGPGDNPRRGVLLSLVIALATVAVGRLDVIAPVVSMFFLISYGLLNFATYYESRAKSPSFRPTFRWHDPRVSLLGALACGA